MYDYNIFQWVMFFMIYCFIGWFGESIYVSIEHKKIVNRGFLFGPFLPIYGFGALIILFATLPVRNIPIFVFLLGMTSATILEYAVGWALEKIFHARYWDYTVQPFNLNGYICLGCSITWGLCALLLMFAIHAPIEKFVLNIPYIPTMIMSIAFCIYFIIDSSLSAQEAFDLKKVIMEQIKHNEEVLKIQRRIDMRIALLNSDIEKIQDKLSENTIDLENLKKELANAKESLQSEISNAKERFEASMSRYLKHAKHVIRRNPGINSKTHSISFEKLKELIKR